MSAFNTYYLLKFLLKHQINFQKLLRKKEQKLFEIFLIYMLNSANLFLFLYLSLIDVYNHKIFYDKFFLFKSLFTTYDHLVYNYIYTLSLTVTERVLTIYN